MILKDEKGIALPLTIAIVAVLLLLGIALLMFGTTETKHVAIDESNLKAHYLARTGAHSVASYIIQNPESAADMIDSDLSEPVEFGEGEFEVQVTGDPLDEIYIISTGRVRDSEQSVHVTVKEVGINFAIYGNSVINHGVSASITGGSVVYGEELQSEDGGDFHEGIVKGGGIYQQKREFDPVVLPCDDPGSVFYNRGCPTNEIASLEGSGITEDITVDSLIDQINLEGGAARASVLTIASGNQEDLILKANDINLEGQSELKVVLDNNTVAIVAENFTSDGGGTLRVESADEDGHGFLMIFVKENFIGAGHFDFATDADVNVNIFVMDEGTIELSGGYNFRGAIYAPDASSVMLGESSVEGWVIADSASIGGSMSIDYSPIELGAIGIDFIFYELEKWRYDE